MSLWIWIVRSFKAVLDADARFKDLISTCTDDLYERKVGVTQYNQLSQAIWFDKQVTRDVEWTGPHTVMIINSSVSIIIDDDGMSWNVSHLRLIPRSRDDEGGEEWLEWKKVRRQRGISEFNCIGWWSQSRGLSTKELYRE